MVNSRRKGAEGEVEFAKRCQEFGYRGARRGQQYNGLEGKDVVGLPGIHLEVKRVQQLNPFRAMDQAVLDSEAGELPAVAWRKNRERWLIVLRDEDFFRLLAQSSDYRPQRGSEKSKKG